MKPRVYVIVFTALTLFDLAIGLRSTDRIGNLFLCNSLVAALIAAYYLRRME